MSDNIKKTALSYDGELIDVSDMPEITDFTGWRKNPFVGKFIKNDKFIVEIEHDSYNEVVEYDIKTGQKTLLQLIIKDKSLTVIQAFSNQDKADFALA